MKRFGFVAMLFTAFGAQASDMGSPGLWFTVFLVAGFLHCGTLYLLGSLVFVTCAKEGQANHKLAYGVPTVAVILSFLGFATTDFAQLLTIGAATIGWVAALGLHVWASKKWQSFREKSDGA